MSNYLVICLHIGLPITKKTSPPCLQSYRVNTYFYWPSQHVSFDFDRQLHLDDSSFNINMTKRHFPQFACSITVAWIGQWLAHCAGLRACPKNQNRQHFNFAWDLFGHFLKVAWYWVGLNLDVLQIRFFAEISRRTAWSFSFRQGGLVMPCHGEGTHFHF